MTTDTLHPLAAKYLERLRRAARGLPPDRRRELLAEIEGHLSEAIDPSASEAQALTVLEKLGEPEAIIAAEAPEADELPPVAEPRSGQRSSCCCSVDSSLAWAGLPGWFCCGARAPGRCATNGSERSSYPAASRPAC